MSCNMSDDDRDIENDSDVEDDDLNSSRGDGPDSMTKRAHHNALERKRRDHIKDSFTTLRDCVPALVGEKSSRAQILKKASDYIDLMKRKIQCHQQDIDLLIRQNDVLGQQVKTIQKTKYTGNFAAMSGEAHDDHFLGDEEVDEEEEEESDDEEDNVPVAPQAQPKRKKLRR